MTVEEDSGQVYGGVDTHEDSIHVAVISSRGHDLADLEFPTTPAGYRRALAFIACHGDPIAIGIEGTSSYGVGITAAAVAAGLLVVEVIRPERAERRRLGKSDPIDAYQAARAALGNHRVAPAKNNAAIEGIRALHNARRSAMKARTAAMRQIHAQLVTAPTVIREKYRDLSSEKRLVVLARMQVPANRTPVERAVLLVLKTLAQRCNELQREHERLGAELDKLVTEANPTLRAAYGIGPDTAAQLLLTAGGNADRLRSEAAFAALCGVSPIPASSGKTVRHRLSRGGDRAANGALYRIALVRMSSDARTREYVARQRDAGLSSKEILRRLKRAIAREVFRHHHARRNPRHRRPAPAASGEEHHPHRRGQPARRVAEHDQRTRARHPPQRRPRPGLPRLARRGMSSGRNESHPNPASYSTPTPPGPSAKHEAHHGGLDGQ